MLTRMRRNWITQTMLVGRQSGPDAPEESGRFLTDETRTCRVNWRLHSWASVREKWELTLTQKPMHASVSR